MVIMDMYHYHDKLSQLWDNINSLHLSYLEMDESNEKLNHRVKLEDCIRDYLSLAAHPQKFCLRETAEVLHRSAATKKDFSAYRAAIGWNSVQLYAGNLLTQPWRREYRQLKTYCGFFMHQIEANLVGAEILFEAMGYKHCGSGILALEGPICPDRLTDVSRDCLVAYVECQIMKVIWEAVPQNFNMTWLDVLEYRKMHSSSAEQAIRVLNYELQHGQYPDHGNSSYLQAGYANRLTQNNLPHAQSCSFSGPGHNHPPSFVNHAMSPQYLYATNGCCPGNYGAYVPPSGYCPMSSYAAPSALKPPCNANGYYCTNGYSHPQQNMYAAVPTGQLIELDANNQSSYDAVDKGNYSRHSRSLSTQITNDLRNKNDSTKMKEFVEAQQYQQKNENQFEDWDYVYRNLESQGYCKDLGERGDILKENSKRQKNTNLDDALNERCVNNRPLKISEALEKCNNSRENLEKFINATTIIHERKHSQSSSYENLSNSDKKHKTKTLSREKLVNSVENNKFKTLDMKTVKEKKKDTWQCKYCTYLNENKKDICEMCSRSKMVVDQQMEIGGAQCSKCTLVNPKEITHCQACNSSLKGSPTYI